MSRGPVARSDAIGEQLPESLVTLMRIDLQAQNHAAVEGAADPFPSPREERPLRARAESAHARESRGHHPQGGGTHVANPGGTPTQSCDQSCVPIERFVYPSEAITDE